ncbi:patatin-like phospholipase family protein [Coxiella burnetii]|uniref:patatin-like phospholipase family protein n=1 Tax=Coxiella burnetii TaxID=777 RepID=UPI000BFDE5BF|nr:patatin-like phospholipase family protein [Coxiella burnetii]PHH58084.1 cyclic nucleotide-binding protein [Coxiella burnetii]
MTNETNLIDVIKRIKFFSSLPDEKAAELVPHFNKVNLQSGETLFYQRDDSLFLYILIKGKLISELSTASQEKIIVGTINPIETVGELGSLSGEPRSLTVKAATDSVVLELPNKIFKEFCQEYPAILTDISKFIVDRSLQIIKIMAQEEARKVNLIFPLLQKTSLNLSTEILETKFNEIFFRHQEVYYTNEQKSEINKTLQIDEIKPVSIFLKSWDSFLFTEVIDRLACVYLVVESEQPAHFDQDTKKIIQDIQRLPNVRLELILLQPENIDQPKNTKKWLEKFDFDLHHHLQLNQSDSWARLIRFMTGKATALVLGGGGARGFSHFGTLKALRENNIPIDAIGGTSVGSVVAACYAMTQDCNETMKLLQDLKRAAKHSFSLRNLTWPFISLFSSHPLTTLLMSTFGSTRIEDLWIPFFAIFANLVDKDEFVQKRGLLWEAVRSSSSLPGIYPPIVKKGKLLLDGGLINNLPVDTMREMIGNDHKIVASQLSKQEMKSISYHFPFVLPLGKALL